MTPGRGRGTQKFKRGCGRNTRGKKAPRAQRTRESRLRGKAPGPERTRRVNKRGDPTATDTHRAAPRRPGRRADSPPSARNLDAFSSRRAGPGAPTATAEEPHTRPSGNERPPRGSRRGFLQPSITHHPFARPCPTRGWGRGGGGSRPGRERPPRTSRAPTVPAHKADTHRLRTRDGSGRRAALTEAWEERTTPGDGKGLRASNQNPPSRTRPNGQTRQHTPARKRKSSAAQRFPATDAGPGPAGPSPDSEGGGAGHGR